MECVPSHKFASIMSYSGVRSAMRIAFLSTVVATGLVLAAGCSSVNEEDPTGPNPPERSFAYETVQQSAVELEALEDGKVSKFRDGMERVIRDPDEFASFWHDLHGGDGGDFEDYESGSIDFSEEVVVVKILGERPNDEYEVNIEGITKSWSSTGAQVSISVTETKPGPSCSASGAEVIPYHIVTTSKFSADRIRFQDKSTETKDCSE